MSKRWLVCRLAFALCCGCAAAWAQDSAELPAAAPSAEAAAAPEPAERLPALTLEEQKQQRADALVKQADGLYQAGQFAAALSLMHEAYALVPSAHYLFGFGLIYRASGDCNGARESFERYLAHEPAGDGSREATEALRELNISCPRPPPRQTQSPLKPVPGEPLPSGKPSRPESRAGASAIAWSLLGAGTATAAATVVWAVLASKAKSRSEQLNRQAAADSRPYDECCAARGSRLTADRQRYQTLFDVFALGSIALVGSGVTLLLVEVSPDSSVSVAAEESATLRYQVVF